MKPLKAGSLRHTIEIQELSSEQDTFGSPQATWKTIAIRRCELEPLSGRNAWLAQQVIPEATHRIRLRYHKGLALSAKTHRFRFQASRILYLLGPPVDIEERHVLLECTCTEAAA